MTNKWYSIYLKQRRKIMAEEAGLKKPYAQKGNWVKEQQPSLAITWV